MAGDHVLAMIKEAAEKRDTRPSFLRFPRMPDSYTGVEADESEELLTTVFRSEPGRTPGRMYDDVASEVQVFRNAKSHFTYQDKLAAALKARAQIARANEKVVLYHL